MAINLLGLTLAGLFLSICLFHLYWALAGKNPSGQVIPTQAGRLSFRPTPAMTLFVALGLLISALIVLGLLGFWRFGLPSWLFNVGIWGLAVVFLLRAIGDFHWVGFFKTIRHTPFAHNDTWLYSPLCLLIATACTVIGVYA